MTAYPLRETIDRTSGGQVIRPGRPVVRTTFQFAGTLVPSTAQSIEDLERQSRSLVCDWLEGKFPERLSPSARAGESFEIDVHGQRLECVAIQEDRLWSVRLIQPDTPFGDRPAVPGRTWTTEIALVRESTGVRFAIRVACASLRFAGKPVTLTRPRIVIDLANRFTLREARPIRAHAWRPQSETELFELQELLTSPERGLPVYLLTTPDKRRLNMRLAPFLLDHERLARRVQGLAHVVTMPRNLGYKWTELVGKPWSAYWGAVRTYRPGLDVESQLPTNHPLMLAERILAFKYKNLTMERAFEEFLVDRAFEHSAGRHVNWGPCLFYVDARRRRAELTRATATEDSEWRALYEEELASLRAKIEQLEHERDDALNIADSAEKDRAYYMGENQRLRARVDSLGFQLSQKTGKTVDATTCLPTSYDALTQPIDEALVADMDASQDEKREMDVAALFVAHAQSAVLMQPTDRALDHPARRAQALAFRLTTTGNAIQNPPRTQRQAMSQRVIGLVGKGGLRSAAGRPRLPSHRRNAVDERDQLRDIGAVGRRDPDREGDAVGIRDHVVFRAGLAAIRRIGAGLVPPKTARTLELSATARDQSIFSASRRRLSMAWWMSSQTPASCQSRSRRQQVMPLPQPDLSPNN